MTNQMTNFKKFTLILLILVMSINSKANSTKILCTDSTAVVTAFGEATADFILDLADLTSSQASDLKNDIANSGYSFSTGFGVFLSNNTGLTALNSSYTNFMNLYDASLVAILYTDTPRFTNALFSSILNRIERKGDVGEQALDCGVYGGLREHLGVTFLGEMCACSASLAIPGFGLGAYALCCGAATWHMLDQLDILNIQYPGCGKQLGYTNHNGDAPPHDWGGYPTYTDLFDGLSSAVYN